VQAITPKPVRYLVNTHFHWDHWQGNEVYPAAFPEVEIVTSEVTREAMVRKSVKRIQDQIREMPAEIAALPEGDDRREAEAFLTELRGLKPALPTVAAHVAGGEWCRARNKRRAALRRRRALVQQARASARKNRRLSEIR